jgi:hypothetical protein
MKIILCMSGLRRQLILNSLKLKKKYQNIYILKDTGYNFFFFFGGVVVWLMWPKRQNINQ